MDIIHEMVQYVVETLDQEEIKNQKKFLALRLPQACQEEVISADLFIYEVIPVKLGHNYKIEIFDSFSEISPHYHKIQTQIIIGLEGLAKIDTINEKNLLMPGKIVTIPPGLVHGIVPIEKARFIAIDFPGFNYPQDVYEDFLDHDTIIPAIIPDKIELFEIHEGYYLRKIQQEGFTVYELAQSLDKTWSVAILDIMNAPRHFHKNGIECFLVLSGELTIECDGLTRRLKAGQSISIEPGIVHSLQSESDSPVRVLCLNFLAFDENDFYLKPTALSL